MPQSAIRRDFDAALSNSLTGLLEKLPEGAQKLFKPALRN